jgi:hypothetical protein
MVGKKEWPETIHTHTHTHTKDIVKQEVLTVPGLIKEKCVAISGSLKLAVGPY